MVLEGGIDGDHVLADAVEAALDVEDAEREVHIGEGAVEIMLGAALVVLPRERRRIGSLLAAFFVAVFPGNLAQAAGKRSAFGLDSDGARITRLFFQPVLVAWALWSTRD